MEKKHIDYIDILRIFGAIGVIYMHTAAVGLRADITPGWHFMNLGASLSFTAVPLFFMISGYLLLSSERTLQTSALRFRMPKLVVPLAVWSVIAVIAKCLKTEGGASASTFFGELANTLFQPAMTP